MSLLLSYHLILISKHKLAILPGGMFIFTLPLLTVSSVSIFPNLLRPISNFSGINTTDWTCLDVLAFFIEKLKTRVFSVS